MQLTRRRALPTSPASHHPHGASLSAPLPIAHDFSFGANSTLPAEKLERRAAAGALYSATPIIGRIYTATELPRDYAVENTPNPWSDLEYTWDGRYQPNPSKTATVLAVNKKAYRVLIRCARSLARSLGRDGGMYADSSHFLFLCSARRALRITADPTLESSWDSWLSPAFSFSS